MFTAIATVACKATLVNSAWDGHDSECALLRRWRQRPAKLQDAVTGSVDLIDPIWLVEENKRHRRHDLKPNLHALMSVGVLPVVDPHSGNLVRWSPGVLALVLIANSAVWFGFSFWGLSWYLSLILLVSLAILAGGCSPLNWWGTVAAMFASTMFIGGEYHGHPWQWLVYGQYAYYMQNMFPILLGYGLTISIGRLAGSRVRRSSSSTQLF